VKNIAKEKLQSACTITTDFADISRIEHPTAQRYRRMDGWITVVKL